MATNEGSAARDGGAIGGVQETRVLASLEADLATFGKSTATAEFSRRTGTLISLRGANSYSASLLDGFQQDSDNAWRFGTVGTAEAFRITIGKSLFIKRDISNRDLTKKQLKRL